MDKNRGRITIKLGQAKDKAQAVQDPPVGKPNQVSNAAKTDRAGRLEGSMTRPEVDIEHGTKEEAAKKGEAKKPGFDPLPAQGEIAASRESSHDWDFPGRNRYLGGGRKRTLLRHRMSKPRLGGAREVQARQVLGIALSVAGAVALGLLFGLIVLSFFKSGFMDHGETGSPSAGSGPAASQQQSADPPAPVQTEGASAPSPDSGAQDITKVSITMPARTFFVVQGGVFQDRQSAEPIIGQMKEKGWPIHFSGEKPVSLYIGLAVNRDHALALASQFKDIEVFVKEVSQEAKTVSVPVKPGAAMTQEEWDEWFEREADLRTKLGQAIAEGLTASRLEAERMNQVTDAHRQLLRKGRELFSKLPESQQDAGNRLLNDWTMAVSAIGSYQQKSGAGILWQAEQSLLNAFESEKQLLSLFE